MGATGDSDIRIYKIPVFETGACGVSTANTTLYSQLDLVFSSALVKVCVLAWE